MATVISEVESTLLPTSSDQTFRPKKAKSDSKTHRLQVELPPRSFDRLARLKEATEAPSHAEVVRNSMRLYELMINEVQAGRQFLVKEPSGTIVPFNVFLEP